MAAKVERLLCPLCESQTRVVETRQVEPGLFRRRRICDTGHRFSSWEMSEARFCRKRAGWLQRFDEAKLRTAIQKATVGISVNEDRIIDDVLRATVDSPRETGDAITTEAIGKIILRGLSEEDPSGISVVRFGSVFLQRHFDSPEDLLAGIQREIHEPALYVIKRHAEAADEREADEPLLQPFDYTKLRRSIRHALRKTPYRERLEPLVNAVADLAMQEAQKVE